jgi:Protein of unknown function (DUF3435)
MRHEHGSAVIHAYLNRRTNCDIQALIHNHQPRQGLLRVFAHMGLHRDPRAPVRMPDHLYDALPPDPAIVALEQKKDCLKRQLRTKSTISDQRSKGSEAVKSYDLLVAQLNAARVKRRKEMDDQFREDYFRKRHSEDIARQLEGVQVTPYVEPTVEHQVGERNELQRVLCDDRDHFSSEQIAQRQRQAGQLLARLCSRREVQHRHRRANVPKQQIYDAERTATDSEAELRVKVEGSLTPEPLELFPLKCKKTQCPVCIGDESLEYEQRVFCYSRPAKMMDHVEGHLRGLSPDAKVPCWHPHCRSGGIILDGVMHYKNHVITVHDIALRA